MACPITRRTLLGSLCAAPVFSQPQPKPDLPFPVVDFHAHLSPRLTIERLMELSRERNVRFGVLEHPGRGQQIQTDADLERYIGRLRKYPVHVGIQPIYPGWSSPFSPALVRQLDYVLMDALTVPEDNGTWTEIWRPNTVVNDEEAFMQKYLKFIARVLTQEKIDIFGWPTYLPAAIQKNYTRLWTKERRRQVVDLAKAKGVAIEINEFAKVPDADFILLAKSAGLKFTFGSDARNDAAGALPYCIETARRCGLTIRDMYMPRKA